MGKPNAYRLRKHIGETLRKDPRKELQKQKSASKSAPTVQSERKVLDSSAGNLVFPSGETAFKAILSARFCAAVWSHISDCDETFNYWEPTHYLVFKKGLQTWEYSPQFALRSYLYLMVHSTPLWIYNQILHPNPLLMFYFLRCLFGLASAFAEVNFYKSVCKEFGVHIGRICLIFQLFAPGFFIASTAYLPSSFAMYCFTAACASWWRQRYALAIFFIALGSLLGWPFAALLGVPIAFDMLFLRKSYVDFFAWSAISAFVICVPMILIDSYTYGRFTVAPLNIVKYNVLGGAGPELYGTEPFSYYLINGFLNFNFIWVLALLCPLFLVINYFFVPVKNQSTLYLPHWLSLSPMWLWLAVFMFQAHKEERFLFPIYPMICLSGAISVDIIQKLYFRVWHIFMKGPSWLHYLDKSTFIMVVTLVVTSLLGISRAFALYRNFHAPLDLMIEINRLPNDLNIPSHTQVHVCYGKDWHRFPSSFFLPNQNWNVHFVKSEFDGMLPAHYSSLDNATKIVHKYFNDQNKEESSLYFDVNKCHFLLDLDLGKETKLEPNYAKMTDKWVVISTDKFVNSEKSNRFARAFYIPFVTEKYLNYGHFSVLQNLKNRIIT